MSKFNNQDIKVTIAQAVEVMSKRLPHTVGARFLRSHGIFVSRSWAETIAKVTSLQQDSAVAVKAAEKALELLHIHSLIGNKRITWYNLSGLNQEMLTKFEKWIEAAVGAPPINAEWVEKYPFPLAPTDDAVLKSFDQTHPVLVSVWTEGARVFFQFFNVRAYNEREELSPTGFSEDAYESIKQYSQIFGVKRKFVPCFDAVVVDLAEKRVELRIDIPGHIVPNDVQQIAAQRTLETFNELTYAGCGVSVVGLSVFDFFPVLLPLYRDKGAGKVSTLGFAAYGEDTASNNTGKPLRKRGHDLRDDRFHKGGAEAVEDLRPYTIGVEWPALGRQDEVIDLEIPGNIHCLYKARLLSVANLSGCVTYEEYEFLIDQIKHYSEAAKKDAALAAIKAQEVIAKAKVTA